MTRAAGAAGYRQCRSFIAGPFRRRTGSVIGWRYFTTGTRLAQASGPAAAAHSAPGAQWLIRVPPAAGAL